MKKLFEDEQTYTAFEFINDDDNMLNTILESNSMKQLETRLIDAISQLAYEKVINIEYVDIDLLVNYYNDMLNSEGE
jgi:hypothetical protein